LTLPRTIHGMTQSHAMNFKQNLTHQSSYFIFINSLTIMIEALQKTLILLLLIGLGLALRSKIKNKTEISGIKEIILSIALPATVFIALMGIKMSFSLLIYPILILAFNFFIFLLTPKILPIFGIEKDSSSGRTLTMLLPSLAPGLSSFPFINEFLGDDSLALAAMGDVGNKFFALNFLYFVAMGMYLKNNHTDTPDEKGKVKSLLLSLVKEPINIIMLLAIIFLSFGLNMTSLPTVVSELFTRASSLMTPLVLIYIGMAVQLKEGKIKLVSSILLFRAGVTLLFSTLIITIFNISEPKMVLLAVVVPLSSCSFWPFAHISGINLKEDNKELSKDRRTFDMNLAVLILAFSLPLSTILVMGILASGEFFAHTSTLLIFGLFLTGLGLAPHLVKKPFIKFSKA
jgi:malate permease and related proteins